MTRKNFDYSPNEIESKWQKKWSEAQLFDVDFDPKKPKKYVLEMLPYPSGRLHMGHARNYCIGDVMARFYRLRGFNVLHPMGWDAFGLPAENAAIQNGIHPKKWTYENIATMKAQMNKLGLSYDWRREVTTCEPEYYKWEQVMFLRMLKEGLAYREKRLLNWCPSCETVLANEEVVEGLCWRCDSVVIQKEMDQWFLKITQYADELLEWIDKLEQWPARVRIMQKHWIGKSDGAEIHFEIENKLGTIKVFTTRPDTVYGVTALVLAPEHTLVGKLTTSGQKNEVIGFSSKMKSQDRIARTAETTEKLGVFTGSHAFHPLTKEKIPIWLANFVLTDYGTGALMAVPAHDDRDYEFAAKYKLPIKKVVNDLEAGESTELPFTGDGVSVASPEIEGLKTLEAKRKITKILEAGKVGEGKINYRLRDWGISRQRYWGCPIPVIHCPKDGVVPVPEKDLPVRLPDDVEFKGKGGSPLAHHKAFMEVKCPKCGGNAKREPDTMSTFVESSWYYARYTSVKGQHGDRALNKKDCDLWLPIDHYIGGVEHATGHALYFRFFQKLLRDWGWLSGDEPALHWICQGMVYKDGAKMSKSKGNVVDPDELIARLGADTARLFVLFAGPIEKDLEWSDKGVEGCFRFLGRVYRLVMNSLEELKGSPAPAADSVTSKELRQLLHRTIKKVTEDIEKDFHYNTAISFMMELVNHLYSIELKMAEAATRQVFKQCLKDLVLMLSPFAPHMCDELWEQMGEKGFTLNAAWPVFDPAFARVSEREIVVQVNGKIKGRVVCADGTPEDKLKQTALAIPKIKELLDGKQPKRIIVVPNKLVNIVI